MGVAAREGSLPGQIMNIRANVVLDFDMFYGVRRDRGGGRRIRGFIITSRNNTQCIVCCLSYAEGFFGVMSCSVCAKLSIFKCLFMRLVLHAGFNLPLFLSGFMNFFPTPIRRRLPK